MAEMKFEEAIKKLEKIVADLEKDDITLDNALRKFEEGVKLSKCCTKKLKDVENKIEILMKNDEGKITKKPFEIGDKEE